MLRHLFLVTLAVLMAGLISSGCQQSQSYPTKPIEYVVHSSSGGGSDIMARTIADIMTKEKIVSQPITVVNKSGGASAVASAYVAEKKGDPYFIYNVTGVHVNTTLTGGTKLTLHNDFTPVVSLVTDVNCVVVNANSPYKTLKDLTDAAKTEKQISQGGASITSTENTTGFAIRKATGAKWEFVPFNSGGEAMTALLGGHVDLVIPSPNEAVEQVRAGKARVLAVSGDKRLDFWPEVPTLTELGIQPAPASFRGIVMPKDVPADAVKYWEDAFGKLRETEGWKKFVKDSALIDIWMPSKEFAPFLGEISTKYEGIMTEMGLLKK